jgi:hypothetical protein
MDPKLLVFVLALSFAFTGFVYERVDQQQQKLDTLLELQKAAAARECAKLPTENERLHCMAQVYSPPRGENE